jgi:hypothetical protein
MIFISGYENDLYTNKLSEDLGWETKTIETTTKVLRKKEKKVNPERL